MKKCESCEKEIEDRKLIIWCDDCRYNQDEFNIKPILEKFNIEDKEFSLAMIDHLDKNLSIYLENHDEIKKSSFTEMKCYIQMALIDTEDNNGLRDRINKIVDAI